MSGKDGGNDQSDRDQGFLARWSQRKRAATPTDRDAVGGAEAAPVADGDAAAAFDLSSLPRLEDLTEATDITGFLRKGVPEQLRNAALRKSWALDPAIRNYVNPALDYAYDWNTPGGVPGSSEIGAGMDVARLVSQIMGGGEATVEPVTSSAASDAAQLPHAQIPQDAAAQKFEADLPTDAVRTADQTISQKPSKPEASEHVHEEINSAAPQQAVRRHGSAKPLV